MSDTTVKSRTVKVAVFSHKDSTFVVPGHWYSYDIEDNRSPPIVESMMLGVVLGCKHEWREFPLTDDDKIDFSPNGALQGELYSPALTHGGCTAWFLSGPEFDRLHDSIEAKSSTTV